MPELMRDKSTLALTILACSVSLLDVFSSWTLLSVPVAGACLAVAIAGIALGARRLRLALLCLVIAIMGLHLGFRVHIDYERSRWDSLAHRKAERALASVLESIDEKFADVRAEAEYFAGKPATAHLVEALDRRGLFELLDEAGPEDRLRARGHGIIITDASGAMLAWSGALPSDVKNPYGVDGQSRTDVTRSTTHYWIRSAAPVGLGAMPAPGEATGFGAPLGTGMPHESEDPAPGWVYWMRPPRPRLPRRPQPGWAMRSGSCLARAMQTGTRTAGTSPGS
jgi:hypothetical protein